VSWVNGKSDTFRTVFVPFKNMYFMDTPSGYVVPNQRYEAGESRGTRLYA